MEPRLLLQAIEEVIDVEDGSLQGDEQLDNLTNWDSLSFLSFLAMADSRFGVKVLPEELRECTSVKDLCTILAQGSEAERAKVAS
jgi:acyl carrier protein